MSAGAWQGGIALLALALGAAPARAFLGVADTSFVTVIANPAEAANWAAELDRLNSEIAAAQGTLGVVGQLRAYAGDPRAAVAGAADLGSVSGPLLQLASGSQTAADLAKGWQALGGAGRLAATTGLLAGAGRGSAMTVFGQAAARDSALYLGDAAAAAEAAQARTQVAQEQAARAAVAAGLTAAWARFRGATTESSKQAILTEISQLQSQSAVLDARRRALLDDVGLADRQDHTLARVRAEADDESRLAESAQLGAAVAARAQGAEAQRLATLQKAPAVPAAPDYSGMKVWTTADAGGGP